MIGILTLIFVIALSMLITKVATIALTHTGMERERAKFQARSAFTGAGFTTNESEMVVKHPMRRKIIMTLLLLGNAGLVTAISSLIISFTGPQGDARSQLHNIYLLLAGIFLLYLSTRSKRLERLMDRIIIKLLNKYTDLGPKSFSRLMTIMDDYEVMEVPVGDNSWLKNSTLADLPRKASSFSAFSRKTTPTTASPAETTALNPPTAWSSTAKPSKSPTSPNAATNSKANSNISSPKKNSRKNSRSRRWSKKSSRIRCRDPLTCSPFGAPSPQLHPAHLSSMLSS